MATTLMQPFGKKLVAGDRWKWTVSLADYPASAWQLIYTFVGGSKLAIAATASGTDHQLDALPAATGNLEPGFYDWTAAVELLADATEHYSLARGRVWIQPNLAAAAAGSGQEFRSAARQALDAVRANLLKKASREEEEYQIGGRMLKLVPYAELKDMESDLAAVVRQEEIEDGVADPASNMVHVRFGVPS